MKITVERLIGWKEVLNSARITVNKSELDKEPSDSFKRSILLAEHSPIRNLTYKIVWEEIPYWVAMHFRTHHIGFRSGEDDIYFIQTQRTDRTQVNRDKLYQNELINMSAILNAQSIINVSRKRLCFQTAEETRNVWKNTLEVLKEKEKILYYLCMSECVYRGFCPERVCCGWCNSVEYDDLRKEYVKK
jgi:hypothetical protein